MIKRLLLTTVLLAAASPSVFAEPHRGGPPLGKWEYSRPYSWCEAKARRLHEYTHNAKADHVVTRWEARNIRDLERDLSNSCGGGRWAPDRGWHRG